MKDQLQKAIRKKAADLIRREHKTVILDYCESNRDKSLGEIASRYKITVTCLRGIIDEDMLNRVLKTNKKKRSGWSMK